MHDVENPKRPAKSELQTCIEHKCGISSMQYWLYESIVFILVMLHRGGYLLRALELVLCVGSKLHVNARDWQMKTQHQSLYVSQDCNVQ